MKEISIKNIESSYTKLANIKEPFDLKIYYENESFLELQYLCMLILLNNNVKNVNIQFNNQNIESENNKEWVNISDYLYFIKQNKLFFNEMRIIECERKKLKKTYAPGKVIPLIYLDKDIYHVLKKPIKKVLKINNNHDNKNYFDFNNLEKYPTDFEGEILKICCRNLLPSSKSDIVNKYSLRYENLNHISSPYFYELTKNMNLLSFLIFCIYFYYKLRDKLEFYNTELPNIKYIYRKEYILKHDRAIIASDNSDYLKNEFQNIINCCELSDGILQLIENIVYHSGDEKDNGRGFLSLRIYSLENKKNYLFTKYSDYFDGLDCRNYFHGKNEIEIVDAIENLHSSNVEKIHGLLKDYELVTENQKKRKTRRIEYNYFIEINIADCSHKNLVTEYLNEIATNRGAKDVKENLQKQNFSLKDVFDNSNKKISDLMDEFNKREENAIHHYGLQLFDSLILSNDGYFFAKTGNKHSLKNIYSTCGVNEKIITEKMQGTHFKILLPFQEKMAENQFRCADVNIKYKNIKNLNIKESNKEENIKLYKDLYKYLSVSENYLNLDEKEKNIACIFSYISKIINRKNLIYVFDVLKISNIELFIKGVLLFLSKENKSVSLSDNGKFYIAFKNCSAISVIEIILILAVFYNKKGDSKISGDVEFFLYNNENSDEFWICGHNIKEILNIISKNCLSRGYKTVIYDIFESYLRKKPSENNLVSECEILPFDTILKNDDGITLFEEHTKNLLQKSIFHSNTGFKLNNTHVRIGSKIHLDSFYEAELLFHNSYYTSRFAKLISQRLLKLSEINNLKKYVNYFNENIQTIIIGYEIYSEMLVYELSEEIGNNCKYSIFTNTKGDSYLGDIKNFDSILEEIKLDNCDLQVIYIVPISTTLTTFGKLKSKFEMEINKKSNNLTIIDFYFSIIEVRDEGMEKTEIEKKYWYSLSISNRFILYPIENKSDSFALVNYLIDLEVKWQDALSCELCYPAEPINEIPLIETNKSSVVPMLSIGMTPHYCIDYSKYKMKIDSKTLEKLKGLEDFLYFGHYARGIKHYNYYIDTSNYFMHNFIKIMEWLRENKNKCNKTLKDVITYNIIISPLHSSNSSFVKLVHKELFDESALLVHIDTDKEYRGNFYTKYIYIKDIYDNLCDSDIKSVINLYYVDDEIIRGNSIMRAKSLISTLFDRKNDNVEVNLFKGIIVLIDRLSNNTKDNYIEDRNMFFSYINIRISHLRTHEESCFLCQRYYAYKFAMEHTVHIELKKYFKKLLECYKVKSIDELTKRSSNLFNMNKMLSDGIIYDGFKMLFSTHIITKTLDSFGFQKNNKDTIFSFIMAILNDSNLYNIFNSEIEKIIYFVVALSSPFLVYRKGCLDAIFDLIIILLEMIIFEGRDFVQYVESKIFADESKNINERLANKRYILRYKDEINGLNRTINDSKEEKDTLLIILMEQSVMLNSNYLIRYNNLFSISKYFSDKKLLNESMQYFYVALVYQLINNNTDESKSHFLEYEIKTNLEYNPKNNNEHFNDKIEITKNLDIELKTKLQKMFDLIFLDNTKIYQTALKNMTDSGLKSIDVENKYFLNNMYNVLKYLGYSSRQNNRNKKSLNKLNIKSFEKMSKDSLKKLKRYSLINLKKNFLKEVIDNLVSIYEYLFNKIEEGKEHNQTIKFYDELSRKLSDLFVEEIHCYFCYMYKDRHLECRPIKNDSKEIYEVVMTEINKLSLLSENSKNEVKLKEIENRYFEFASGTYIIRNSICLIRFDQSNLQKDNHIYLVIQAEDKDVNLRSDHFRNIKLVFLFYNQINEIISQHFKNDLLQDISHMKYLKKQFEKARAFNHSDDENGAEDESNMMNAMYWSNIYLFGYPQKNIYLLHDNKLKSRGWSDRNLIFGLFTNSIIGKMNMRLLSNQSVRTGIHWNYLAMRIDSTLRSCSWMKYVQILDQDKNVYNRKNIKDLLLTIFPDNQDIYIKNKNNKLIDVHDFSALFIELIKSAYIYGDIKENIVKIQILKSGKYLCISNIVQENFDIKIIKEGFARENEGISLAVLGETIYWFYESENLIIEFDNDNNKLVFKLPIYLN